MSLSAGPACTSGVVGGPSAAGGVVLSAAIRAEIDDCVCSGSGVVGDSCGKQLTSQHQFSQLQASARRHSRQIILWCAAGMFCQYYLFNCAISSRR